jgi:hypothetical protein
MFDDHFDDLTDEEGDYDTGAEGSENANPIRLLREKAARVDAAEAAMRDTQRELAMLRAGVNTTSRLGVLFLKHWDGDVSDRETLINDAREIGLLKDPGSED